MIGLDFIVYIVMQTKKIISSSFLAIRKDAYFINLNIILEYILTGSFYGSKTFIKEIETIDSNEILKLGSIKTAKKKES